MKIVIITRAFYPKLSPRSFRATELAKEFARKGHDVTVYSVLGKADYYDFSQHTGVKVKHINMSLATMNCEGECRYNIIDKVLYHLLHKIIEYPDIEFLWKIPSVLKRENGIDLLITIAYPFPIHWGTAVAKGILKEKFPQCWISDCGDPYMGNTVHKYYSYFQIVENYWGRQTDFITIPIEEGRIGYSQKVRDKIRVIPQGFDFSNIVIDETFEKNDYPHFAYAGAIHVGYRDPGELLDYLSGVSEPFKFTIFTSSPDFFAPYKDRMGEKLEISSYIPRDELIFRLSRMDFLVNILNESAVQSPSKLIDYALTKRPVLDVSTHFKEKIVLNEFLHDNYTHKKAMPDIQQYSIETVANQFLSLI